MKLTLLDPDTPHQVFPNINTAMQEPDGLLAAGGCLSVTRLINAYKQGIFPWYNDDEPILWWSPNPRLVLQPEQVKISRSLAKTLRKNKFEIRFDTAFNQVIESCSEPRDYTDGTWISEDMKHAYKALFKAGFAHSAEAWFEGELVGGLYGVAIGQIFFGESMFHKKTDASKVVFAHLSQQLQQWNYKLIDCQVYSSHLASLGAAEIQRTEFITWLNNYCHQAPHPDAWKPL